MLLSSSKPATGIATATSPAPKPPRRVWSWRKVGIVAAFVAWTFIGFMLAQAIGLGIVIGLQAVGVPLDTLDETTYNTAAGILVYSLALVIIMGVPRLFKRTTSLKDLGLQRLPQWKDLGWLFAGFFAYIVLTLTINMLSRLIFPSADYEQTQNTGFEALSSNFEYILAFVSLVIVAPVAEEIMFRGYLFGKLKKHVAVWVSIIVSSALFAVVHFQFNVGIDTFALGIVLCLLRLKTGSLWASIMLHMLKNGIAYYFLFVNPLVL